MLLVLVLKRREEGHQKDIPTVSNQPSFSNDGTATRDINPGRVRFPPFFRLNPNTVIWHRSPRVYTDVEKLMLSTPARACLCLCECSHVSAVVCSGWSDSRRAPRTVSVVQLGMAAKPTQAHTFLFWCGHRSRTKRSSSGMEGSLTAELYLRHRK